MDIFDKTKGIEIVSQLRRKGIYPYFRRIDHQEGVRVRSQGRELIMMSSNNYLGLAGDPRVVRAAQSAIETWGSGCTGSRLLNGHFAIHEDLEQELASFLGFEACLIFASGFAANQGALSALADDKDTLFSDRENHACIIEGCKLSGAKTVVFDHEDLESLDKLLHGCESTKSGKMIVSDTVFSMSGRLADLRDLQCLADRHGARTFFDEAHGLGVLGDGGRGASSLFQVKPDLYMGTFSKALASQGGFICGEARVINWLKVCARTLLFSAGLAPASVAAAKAALQILQSEPERVDSLRQKVSWFRDLLLNEGFVLNASPSAILSLYVGDDTRSFEIAQDLFERGVFATPVIFPAVPKAKACIRLAVTDEHSFDDLQEVAFVLRKLKPNWYSEDRGPKSLYAELL